MAREDVYTHTEADAGRYDHDHFGEEPDRPDPADCLPSAPGAAPLPPHTHGVDYDPWCDVCGDEMRARLFPGRRTDS